MKNMIISSLIIALLLAISLNISARGPLTFEERVKAQEAIEKVFYNHRIWPQANPQPKPSFEKMVPKESIEAKVTEYLTTCAALDKYWLRPIESGQLQAEMDRMAKQSKDPATLNELFAALNNDPYLIAECLARPMLAGRLGSNWYANDERFHKETKEKAEEALKTLTVDNFCSTADGVYGILRFKLADDSDVVDDHQSIAVSEEELKKISSMIPEEDKISGVEEQDKCFLIFHTILKNDVEVEYETLVFSKQDFKGWLTEQNLVPTLPEISTTSYSLPPTTESACTEGWDNGILDDFPDPRNNHTAVWTGTEMIVWGGSNENTMFNTGGRYNPSTDSWIPTSRVGCPTARQFHSAVWTGTEMIIWGGFDISSDGGSYFNTGGRYNPSSDSWTNTSTSSNCPAARGYHTAVWTGSQMIIWGGGTGDGGNEFSSGGRYTPGTNSWSATSTGTGTPSARRYHTAIWTGSKMIVWGGYRFSYLNTGAKYDPVSNTWTATSTGDGCPSIRRKHSAVWTGSEMIIWGGEKSSTLRTGGKYYPESDTWMVTSTGANCPQANGRTGQTAVWTGSEMIIWGEWGYKGRYNPISDTWTSMAHGSNYLPGQYHTAVWTGSEMIVWGGDYYHNVGGKYDPSSDTWVPTSTGNYLPLTSNYFSTAIWTGNEMIVWGGKNYDYVQTGGKYNPALDVWVETSTGANCPVASYGFTAVWTGTEMIIWGGYADSDVFLNTGGRYNPTTDSWTTTSTGENCPIGRILHSAVWTGSEMIIWGGNDPDSVLFDSGGKYNPSNDTWAATFTGAGTPSARRYHTAIWTGLEMIVWGGQISIDLAPYGTNTGGKYNPTNDSWTTTSTSTGCPEARHNQTAIWTGNEVIVWGGIIEGSPYFANTGGRYSPNTDSWLQTSIGVNCPLMRTWHTAVWTGKEMVIWGGSIRQHPYFTNTGAKYDPVADAWNPTFTGNNVPPARRLHTAVWTGCSMIIWGGNHFFLTSGGIYYIPSSPLDLPNNTAIDISGCSDGILIEWAAPSSWGDGGSGTRSFDVLRDGSAIASDLPETTLSYTDMTGNNDVSYLYQVRANNGCGFSTTTTGASAVDINGSPIVQPVITKIVDKSRITRGLVIYYIPGSPAQRHDLYKDGVLAVSGFVSGATFIPGDSLSHAYQIITILNECSLSSNTVNAVDNAATNPPR